jgi:hypothetical protein
MTMPTYIGQINTTCSSNITRAWPGGTQLGDLAVFIGQGNATTKNNTAAPNEAGWTEITPLNNQTSGTTTYEDKGIRVWWRLIASLSNTPITNNGGGNVWASICVMRGFTTAPSAMVCSAVDVSSTAINFPNLNVGTNSLIINYHASARNDAAAQFSTFANANLANVITRIATGGTTGQQTGIVTGESALGGMIGVGTAVLANANKQINLVMAFGDPPLSGVANRLIARRRRIRGRY